MIYLLEDKYQLEQMLDNAIKNGDNELAAAIQKDLDECIQALNN